MPLDQRLDEPGALAYTTEPLAAEFEVTGQVRARLFVSSSAAVAYFRVKLIDVAPDGTAKLVRYGGLNAAHRASHEDPQALEKAEVYAIEIALEQTSYVFAPGHRLRVMIAGADFQNAWPTGTAGVHAVHRGAGFPSCVVLPVVPAPPQPALARPDLRELPPADADDLSRPMEYAIGRDLASQTTSMRLGRDSEEGADSLSLRSEFTVSRSEPANARLTASARYRVRRGEAEVEVHADEVTTSDKLEFRHEAKVHVTRDGEAFWSKGWSVRVPRRLS